MQPHTSPYEYAVCGAGIVEPAGEIVEVAPAIPGRVIEVYVEAGSRVQAGQPLLRLDDAELRAERARRVAVLDRARSELVRLEQPTREPVLAVSEAVVSAARVDRDRARQVLDRVMDLYQRHSAPAEELHEAQYQLDAAESRLARAEADLALLRAGTWEYDLGVARAAVTEAEAGLAQIDVELERLTVRSPLDGDVLKLNVRPGEYVAVPAAHPPVVLGDQSDLYVHADIDEYDIGRFKAGAPAIAVPKGEPDARFKLEFVRVEPLVTAKQSLTGASIERIDTRVLKVIYRIDQPSGLYVGQQVYVCAEGDPADEEALAQEKTAADPVAQ